MCRTFVGVLQQGKYGPTLFYGLWVLHGDLEWLLNSDVFRGCDSTLLHCVCFIAVWESAEHPALLAKEAEFSFSMHELMLSFLICPSFGLGLWLAAQQQVDTC